MKNSRKLLTAGIMVLISLFAVVTATYAWFTVQNTPEVGNLNFSITDGDAVYMSLDKENWKNNFTNNEIYDFLGLYSGTTTKTYDYMYRPVTPTATSNGFTATFNELYLTASPEIGGNVFAFKDVTATVPTEKATGSKYTTDPTTGDAWNSTDAGYVAFTLYFKSVKDVKLYLYGASVKTDSNEINIAAAKMARIGFATSTTKTSVMRVFNPSGKNGDEGKTLANLGGGTFYAKENIENLFRDMVNKTTSSDNMLVKDFTDAGHTTYTHYTFNSANEYVKNIKAAVEKSYNISLIEGSFNSNNINKDNEVTSTKHGDAIIDIPAWNGENIDATGDNFVALTVYLWIEGWDNDTVDGVQNGKFSLDFKFIGVDPSLLG